VPLPPVTSTLSSLLTSTRLTRVARERFRARVSGDPTGAPDWVREIATVGKGPGWFEPDGVVWQVHGDLATLAGGVTALMGQAAHPLALAGVQRHSAYQDDPWKRLAGTARWLVVSTFGSEELAGRESARVRGLHTRVKGTDDAGRPYAASDPVLLRWVHLAFTDAFLSAHRQLGRDLVPRFGRAWPDAYVRQWRHPATALGATDLPSTAAELSDALFAMRGQLEPVPADLRAFLGAPPGLSRPEKLFYGNLVRAAGLLLHPAVAPLAGTPGRGGTGAGTRVQLAVTRTQLRTLRGLLGPAGPSEEAARWRLGTGPAPSWAAAPA
jgi:uncharacterized protein (DUF2236 family)